MPSSRFLYSSGRIAFIQILFVLGFLLLVARLVYLQLFQDVFLDGQVLSRSYSEYSLLAPRGRILDRENNILAFDVISYSVGIDFSKFNNRKYVVMMASPSDYNDFGIGFALSDAFVARAFEVPLRF